MQKAKHYAVDICAAAACYYFAGWYGVLAYAIVWAVVIGAATWLALQMQNYESPIGQYLAGRMGDVMDAINEFGAARDAGDVSGLTDDNLVLACAFYGNYGSADTKLSTSMRGAMAANHALAVAEVERRNLDLKLKNAAAVVASARAGVEQQMDALGYGIIAAKVVAAVAIVSVALLVAHQ
jgi:hypothetical protein